MAINLDNYTYSYATNIGCLLKQPLYTLVSNREAANVDTSHREISEVIVHIAKIVFYEISCFILYVPAAICWFIGKKICLLSNTKISRAGLPLSPPPLEVLAPTTGRHVDISYLSTRYNQLCPPPAVVDPLGTTSKQECLRRMCEKIINSDPNIYFDNSGKRELFLAELSQYLKGITLKIEQKEITPEKEKELLEELAEASTHCYPTWLEVSKKLYAEAAGKSETASIKLLRHVQEYKEDIILHFFQNRANTQWHAINVIRKILGEELGLDLTHKGLDPYAHIYSRIDTDVAKWLFKAQYKDTNRLIESIKTKIAFLPYDPCYLDFLVSIVKEFGVSDPEDYAETHFFGDDYQLNELGVNLMLKSIGVLE